MPTSSDAVLAEIREKIGRIAAQRDASDARMAHLEQEIADLKADLADTRRELHQARLDVEFLTLSHRLADSPDAVAAARKTITSMIRKVDSAINMLKNDPSED